MRTDSLQQFVKLRSQLSQEKSTLEVRLRQINEALGELQRIPAATAQSNAPASQPSAGGRGGKRTMSPAARARIAAAQRARWAASRKGQAKAAPAPASSNGVDDKPKRKMSAAGRKAIAEAARRRWAAAKASGKRSL